MWAWARERERGQEHEWEQDRDDECDDCAFPSVMMMSDDLIIMTIDVCDKSLCD